LWLRGQVGVGVELGRSIGVCIGEGLRCFQGKLGELVGVRVLCVVGGLIR
jgi:hypothetical protein